MAGETPPPILRPLDAAGTERDGEDATDGADKNSIDGDGEDATDGGFAAYDVEPTGEDVGLGVVSVSQGLRVAEDADETTLKAFVTAGNREAVRLGKYLLVPYPTTASGCSAGSPGWSTHRSSGRTTPPRSTLAGRCVATTSPSATTSSWPSWSRCRSSTGPATT